MDRFSFLMFGLFWISASGRPQQYTHDKAVPQFQPIVQDIAQGSNQVEIRRKSSLNSYKLYSDAPTQNVNIDMVYLQRPVHIGLNAGEAEKSIQEILNDRFLSTSDPSDDLTNRETIDSDESLRQTGIDHEFSSNDHPWSSRYHKMLFAPYLNLITGFDRNPINKIPVEAHTDLVPQAASNVPQEQIRMNYNNSDAKHSAIMLSYTTTGKSSRDADSNKAEDQQINHRRTTSEHTPTGQLSSRPAVPLTAYPVEFLQELSETKHLQVPFSADMQYKKQHRFQRHVV